VLDLAPSNIEELTEIITHVEFHKKRSDLFLFSSSNSYFKMCDLRVSSDFAKNSTTYQVQQDPSKKHFFTSIISAISRATFAPTNDNYIFARDYLGV